MAKKTPRKPSPKSDERNVVGADSVDIQDLEDRVFMFWDKNKGLILGGIFFLFAAFIAFQGFKFLQARSIQNLQEGYQTADIEGGKSEWADGEASTALGGIAFKELGDEAYAADNLAEAEAYYRKAVAATKSVVKEAANIALAVTLAKQDKTAEAKQIFQTLADNPEAASQAEAQFRLAKLAHAAGDHETARSLIEAIDPEAAFWKSRARALETKLPKADA